MVDSRRVSSWNGRGLQAEVWIRLVVAASSDVDSHILGLSLVGGGRVPFRLRASDLIGLGVRSRWQRLVLGKASTPDYHQDTDTQIGKYSRRCGITSQAGGAFLIVARNLDAVLR